MSLSTLALNAYSGCLDAEQARALYLRAKGQTADASVHLLQQSATLCENYAVYYKLGINQLKLGHYQNALVSFKNAQHFADMGTQQDAILLGRMAIASYQMQDLSNALAAIDSAHEIYAQQHEQAPAWLTQVRQDIDTSIAQTLFTSDKINETLVSMKNFGIKPKINIKVLFASRSVLIDEQGLEQIKELGKALLSYVQSGQRVLIVGHTDIKGGEQYNQQLSENRAKSVIKTLESIYPELKGSLDFKGMGFSQLRYKGDQEKINRLNRRVEIQLL
jgi:outer membrane protein OmpA-like peptidoglycan-associated protein